MAPRPSAAEFMARMERLASELPEGDPVAPRLPRCNRSVARYAGDLCG